jgi:hypothetical protein
MTDSKIVPFGKYKGRPMEEVLTDDPGRNPRVSCSSGFLRVCGFYGFSTADRRPRTQC